MFLLRLFGEVSLEGSSGRITGRAVQRHRLALLALLTAGRCAGMGRDRIIALLWPETETARGRHLLSQAVYVLRQALGETAILASSDGLRLNPDAVHVDTAEFEKALDRGSREEAIRLYRGPLLDGFFLSDAPEFDRWVEAERDRYRAAYAKALETLADERERERDFVGATEFWRRLTAENPYSSRIAMRLMQALVAAGDSAGALQHAQAHQTLLRDELGIEPDAEIQALVEQIRSRRPADPKGQVPAAAGQHGSAGGDFPSSKPPVESQRSFESATPPREEPAPDLPVPSSSAHDGVWPRSRRVVFPLVTVALLLAIALVGRGWRQNDWSVGQGSALAASRETSAGARPVDPGAYAHYLKGRYLWNEHRLSSYRDAVFHFEQAIALAPDYAPAYSGLADVYVHLDDWDGYSEGGAREKGLIAARRALELDNRLSEAHSSLAHLLMHEEAWAAAERAFRQAIQLSPNDPSTRILYAFYLSAWKRHDEAIRQAAHAVELDPLAPRANSFAGFTFYFDRRYDEAIAQWQRLLQINPKNARVHMLIAQAHLYAGRRDEGMRWARRSMDLADGTPASMPMRIEFASALALAGQKKEAIGVLEETLGDAERAAFDPLSVAQAYARLGDPDRAFRWLEQARRGDHGWLMFLNVDPAYDPLRTDPRFTALLKIMRLER